jgi:hypothetical protein
MPVGEQCRHFYYGPKGTKAAPVKADAPASKCFVKDWDLIWNGKKGANNEVTEKSPFSVEFLKLAGLEFKARKDADADHPGISN